jgi:hypothetical protein
MIADPMVTRVQDLAGSGGYSGAVSLDRIDGPSNGEGTFKSLPATLDGVIAKARVAHSVTKAGRRRSLFRMDVVAPVGTGPFTADNTVLHTASAQLVLDCVDTPSVTDQAVLDVALSTLIHALVTSKAASNDFVKAQVLIDFLNGEP